MVAEDRVVAHGAVLIEVHMPAQHHVRRHPGTARREQALPEDAVRADLRSRMHHCGGGQPVPGEDLVGLATQPGCPTPSATRVVDGCPASQRVGPRKGTPSRRTSSTLGSVGWSSTKPSTRHPVPSTGRAFSSRITPYISRPIPPTPTITTSVVNRCSFGHGERLSLSVIRTPAAPTAPAGQRWPVSVGREGIRYGPRPTASDALLAVIAFPILRWSADPRTAR